VISPKLEKEAVRAFARYAERLGVASDDRDLLGRIAREPVQGDERRERERAQVRDVLAHDFKITHTTIQFERAGLPSEAGLYMPEPARRSEM